MATQQRDATNLSAGKDPSTGGVAPRPLPVAVRPAPLSWKDAVQRAPPLATGATTTTATGASAPPGSTHHSGHAAPRTPTKLAARSRSVSRIVQNATYRNRCELFAPVTAGDADGPRRCDVSGATSDRKQSGTHAMTSAAAAPHPKQVSFATTARTAEQEKDEAKRFADLVNRLGLNDPIQMLTREPVRRETHADGRPRSASADGVLHRRAAPPLWVLTKASGFTSGCKGSFKSRARKDRAMSAPNTTLSAETNGPLAGEARNLDERCAGFYPSAKAATVGGSEEDSSELDCDDTHSESTSDSSCPSPRHSPIVRRFDAHREPTPLDMRERASLDDMDRFSDYMTPEDEEEDSEAFELLDRINCLSAEFKAHREYEESSAMAWSVQHAARQGVISPQMQQNLLQSIRSGSWEEARDVLYHKCHLVPAVGSVTDHPTHAAIDPESSTSLVQCVEELSPSDTSESRLQKLRVLKLLSDLLTKWVKIVGYERGLTEEHVALTSGSLFLAGSYRLGLNDPVSDIDAVCVVPYHVTHEDFFSSFCHLLEQTSGVTHLAPVPNAYVPLISLSFLGVSVDLLFARLPMACVEPHQEIDSDHILVGVDPTSMKALNAPRVSSMLLCLVPKRRVYRTVLRAVRAWARRRGIYSSKLGYLGGISWSILVAFVCQMYPHADAAKVFVRFFQVFSEWQWPRPVMLNMVYDAGLGFEMWDPRQSMYDRAHIMPVITPAYPHMNSAVQVSQSTFSVIYEELWRARYLAEAAAGVARPVVSSPGGVNIGANGQFAVGQLSIDTPALGGGVQSTLSNGGSIAATPASSKCDWDKLFQRSNFFIRYDSYLVVDFHADSPNSMHVWGKFVQSRLRKLVDSLQHVTSVSRVHAFPLYFPNTSDGRTPGSCMFIGIEFQQRSRVGSNIQCPPKDDPEVKGNLERTIRFFLATDLQQLAEKKQDMCAEAKLLNWSELPEFVFEYGRPAALVERAEYHEDMERMTMLQSMHFRIPSKHDGERFGSGKWRSPNSGGARSGFIRSYNGSRGPKPHRNERYQSGSQKPFSSTQAG